MANLNRYLDELSLIKVLLFFILVILVMTLFGMVFNIEYGDLTFKLILYGFMIVFFVYQKVFQYIVYNSLKYFICGIHFLFIEIYG